MNNTAKHKTKLNKQTCKSARCDEGREWTVHWDADIAGFGLRVMASGVKSYIVDYRAPGRRRRQVTLGRFPALDPDDARRLAKKELYSVAAGEDPAERRRREKEGERFEDVSQRYLDDLKQRAESGALKGRLSGWTSQASLIRLHVPPAMKRRRVQDLTVQDVQALHKALAAKPATADKVVGAVGTVLERALGEGLVQVNVARAVKLFNKPGKPRRAITMDELAALGAVLRIVEREGSVTVREKVRDKKTGKRVEKDVERDVDPAAARAIRVLALTGMRRSELVGHPDKKHRGPREGLRWGDVDLGAGTYHLEAHGGGSGAKGGKPRDLPLGKAAVEYLKSFRPAEADDDGELPVIPSPIRSKKYRYSPLVGLDKPRLRIFAAAGIVGADAHCLRHMFETTAYKVAPTFAGVLTGRAFTKDAVLNDYIDRADPEIQAEARKAADAVAERIALALDGKLADVLEFNAAE